MQEENKPLAEPVVEGSPAEPQTDKFESVIEKAMAAAEVVAAVAPPSQEQVIASAVVAAAPLIKEEVTKTVDSEHLARVEAKVEELHKKVDMVHALLSLLAKVFHHEKKEENKTGLI